MAQTYEQAFFDRIVRRLTPAIHQRLDALLQPAGAGGPRRRRWMTRCRSPPLCHPENRSRPCGTGQPPQRAGQAPPVNGAGLTLDLFADVPSKRVQVYCARAATEPPREMRRHPAPVRYTFLAAFCWQRRRDIIDGLVDLLVLIMHRIGVRAERKVVQELCAICSASTAKHPALQTGRSRVGTA